MKRLGIVLACFGLLAVGALAAERPTAGAVTRVQKDASALFAASRRSLRGAEPVLVDDTLVTGAGARLEVALRDGAILTLGESAELVVDANVAGESGDVLRVAAGAFRLAGSLALGRALRVETPFATIGIRGTDFWGGPIDGAFSVLLLDGVIVVENAGGSVTLTEPGTGTSVTAPGVAPIPPQPWATDKISRAVDTVSFAE